MFSQANQMFNTWVRGGGVNMRVGAGAAHTVQPGQSGVQYMGGWGLHLLHLAGLAGVCTWLGWLGPVPDWGVWGLYLAGLAGVRILASMHHAPYTCTLSSCSASLTPAPMSPPNTCPTVPP